MASRGRNIEAHVELALLGDSWAGHNDVVLDFISA